MSDDFDQYLIYGICYIVLIACALFGVYTMGIPIVHFAGIYTVSTNHAPLAIGAVLWMVIIIVGFVATFGWFVEEVVL